jgi:hypothetical protein
MAKLVCVTPSKSGCKDRSWGWCRLRDQASSPEAPSRKTPKAKHSGRQSDRFITDRSAMDFNIANYMLGAKENNCSVDSSLHSPSEVKALKIFSWRMNVETMYVVVPLSLSNRIVILCFSNELIVSFTQIQPASFWNKWVLLLSNVYRCLLAAGVFFCKSTTLNHSAEESLMDQWSCVIL